MCLVVKENAKIAKKDIKCYKLVKVNDKGGYKSYYQHVIMPGLGEEFKVDNFFEEKLDLDGAIATALFDGDNYPAVIPILSKDIKLTPKTNRLQKTNRLKSFWNYVKSFGYVIDINIDFVFDGAIHTYSDINQYVKDMIAHDIAYGDKIAIIECIIPKGTKFYEGYGYGSTNDIACKFPTKDMLNIKHADRLKYYGYASEKIVLQKDVTDKFM